MVHTNDDESMLSMLNRGCQGTLHHFSDKHVDRYVRVFAGRHNELEADTVNVMGRMSKSLVGRMLYYRDLVA